jgi:hypothetical protein
MEKDGKKVSVMLSQISLNLSRGMREDLKRSAATPSITSIIRHGLYSNLFFWVSK